MNKRKRVAWEKHRKAQKKMKEKVKAAGRPSPAGRGAASTGA
jgi:hypothetical protein